MPRRALPCTSDSEFALSAQEAADRVAREGLVNTVHALAKAVDGKDGYTASHSQRVARYAAELASEAKLSLEGDVVHARPGDDVAAELGVAASDLVSALPVEAGRPRVRSGPATAAT